MSDDLVKRLRMVTGFIRFETGDRIAASACLSEESADCIEELEAKLAKAVGLVRHAFNEGFGSGMDDVLKSSGGVTWHDSRSRAVLAEINGERHE